MDKLKGKLTISYVTNCGNSADNYVAIRVEDSSSTIHFLEIKMDLEIFAKALFGQGVVPIEFVLQGTQLVGKQYEYKSVEIKIPVINDGTITEEAFNKVMVEYEIDGWHITGPGGYGQPTELTNSVEGFRVFQLNLYRWI